MMLTPHEFREIGRSEKLFSIFDLCSMMTSAVLNLSMCAVFILVILVSVRLVFTNSASFNRATD